MEKKPAGTCSESTYTSNIILYHFICTTCINRTYRFSRANICKPHHHVQYLSYNMMRSIFLINPSTLIRIPAQVQVVVTVAAVVRTNWKRISNRSFIVHCVYTQRRGRICVLVTVVHCVSILLLLLL